MLKVMRFEGSIEYEDDVTNPEKIIRGILNKQGIYNVKVLEVFKNE